MARRVAHALVDTEDFEFLKERFPHYFAKRRAAPTHLGNRRLLRPSASYMADYIVKSWIKLERKRMEREDDS